MAINYPAVAHVRTDSVPYLSNMTAANGHGGESSAYWYDVLKSIQQRLPEPANSLEVARQAQRLSAPAVDPLAERFAVLASEWKRGTMNSSNLAEIADHPAYKAIIEMGWPVVPHIMASLERSPDLWFAALRRITKADPVPAQSRGRPREMQRAWLRWGRSKNVRW
jgi:hypothetical protein